MRGGENMTDNRWWNILVIAVGVFLLGLVLWFVFFADSIVEAKKCDDSDRCGRPTSVPSISPTAIPSVTLNPSPTAGISATPTMTPEASISAVPSPVPTVQASNVPTSDGKSDGRSSCPECTKTPEASPWNGDPVGWK
jgi:hypothetical protein